MRPGPRLLLVALVPGLVLAGCTGDTPDDPGNQGVEAPSPGGETDGSGNGSVEDVPAGNETDDPSEGNASDAGSGEATSRYPDPGSLEVVRDSSYRDGFGKVNVVGEVWNNGSANRRFVKVTATAYGADGAVRDTDSTALFRDVLGPGHAEPFHLWFDDDAGNVTRYEVEVEGKVTEEGPDRPGVLEVEDTHNWTGDLGWYHVSGEVRNTGEERARNVSLRAVFYNETGVVRATGVAFAEPEEIPPGETAHFEVEVDPGNRTLASHRHWVYVRSMGG